MTDQPDTRIFNGKELSTLGVLMIIVGFFYSFAAMSIGMFLLAGVALWRLVRGTAKPAEKGVGNGIKAFVRDTQWSAPLLILLAVFISGLWSENTDGWLWFSRLKLPFLVLPFAFYFLPNWSERETRFIETFFVLLAFLTTLPVMYDITFHYSEVSALLKQGKPVPTPGNHIRYSMLLAFAAAIALFRSFQVTGKWRWVFLVLFLWLAGSIFMLSTRTGIMVLLASLAYIVIWLIWRRRNFKLALLISFSFILVSALAVQTIPTLKDKISYMRYDWERMKNDEGVMYSDSERWRSIVAGWEIWKLAPLTGVGMGDLEQRSMEYYREKFGLEKYKYPHNQILFVMTTTGLIGLVIFLAGLLIPLSRAFLFKRPEIMILYINVMLAGMVEHTLETATGITFFSLFLVFYTKDYTRSSGN